MRKITFSIILVATLFSACKKELKEPGAIEVTITYFYNNFFGYRNDVGAKIFVYDPAVGKQMHLDSMSVIFARIGAIYDRNGKIIDKGEFLETRYLFTAEANASGVAHIGNVPPGKYFILAASKGRFTYSTKNIEVLPGETLHLTKNFGYLFEWLPQGESW